MARKRAKKKPEKTDHASRLLIENFVSLQKVIADLAMRVSHLTKELSMLLELFEGASRSFKERKENEIITRPSEVREITLPKDEWRKVTKTEEPDKAIISNPEESRAGELSSQESTVEEERSTTKTKPLPEFRF